MKRILLACALVTVAVGEAYACSMPALPFGQAAQVIQVPLTPTRIVTSENGQYLFKMIPASTDRKASATAYKALENGDLKALWSITEMPSLENWI